MKIKPFFWIMLLALACLAKVGPADAQGLPVLEEQHRFYERESARRALTTEIVRAEQLLRARADVGYPAEVRTAFMVAYERARHLVDQPDGIEMVPGGAREPLSSERLQSATAKLARENERLEAFRLSRRFGFWGLVVFLLAVTAIVAYLLIVRWKERKRQQELTRQALANVETAFAPLEDFLARFGEIDARLRGLTGYSWLAAAVGQTKDFCDEIVASLTRIGGLSELARMRLDQCRAKLSAAEQDVAAIDAVKALAEAPFPVRLRTETAALVTPMRSANAHEPHEAEPPPISVADWLAEREKDLVGLQDYVTEIAKLEALRRDRRPTASLSDHWFPGLQQEAAEAGLPACWYEGHPCAVGFEVLCAELRRLLAIDPRGYDTRIYEIRAIHQRIQAEITEVAKLLRSVSFAPSPAVTPAGMVVEASETPEALLIREKVSFQDLRTFVRRRVPLPEVRTRVALIKGLRERATELAAQLADIAKEAPTVVTGLRGTLTEIERVRDALKPRVDELALLFINRPQLAGATQVDPEFNPVPFRAIVKRLKVAGRSFEQLEGVFKAGRYAQVLRDGAALAPTIVQIGVDLNAIVGELDTLAFDRAQLPFALISAGNLKVAAQARWEAALARLLDARTRHASTSLAGVHLETARQQLAAGRSKLASAAQAQQEIRFRSGRLTADAAERDFLAAQEAAQKAIAACLDLDRRTAGGAMSTAALPRQRPGAQHGGLRPGTSSAPFGARVVRPTTHPQPDDDADSSTSLPREEETGPAVERISDDFEADGSRVEGEATQLREEEALGRSVDQDDGSLFACTAGEEALALVERLVEDLSSDESRRDEEERQRRMEEADERQRQADQREDEAQQQAVLLQQQNEDDRRARAEREDEERRQRDAEDQRRREDDDRRQRDEEDRRQRDADDQRRRDDEERQRDIASRNDG